MIGQYSYRKIKRNEGRDIMDYRPHRKLDVWKKSMEFVRDIYQATEQFPKSEIYGLSSQVRRAAISIPSNSCPIK